MRRLFVLLRCAAGRALTFLAFAAIGLAAEARSPAQVIEAFPQHSINEGVRARQALDEVEQARREYRVELERRRYECHQRLTVNRCLGQVDHDRRLVEGQLRAIDIRARQVIRQVRVVERNADEARAGSSVSAPVGPLAALPGSTPAAPIVNRTDMRIAERQARLERHRARLAESQATGRREAERRRARLAELQAKRLEQRRKIEQGRANAAAYRERQQQAESRRQASKSARTPAPPAADGPAGKSVAAPAQGMPR